MSTAEFAILISIAAIVSGALVAGIASVWRLGSKVGRFETKIDGVVEATRADRLAHDTLSARIDDTNEHVAVIDERLACIETRCDERREQSKRFDVPPQDGTPKPVGCK